MVLHIRRAVLDGKGCGGRPLPGLQTADRTIERAQLFLQDEPVSGTAAAAHSGPPDFIGPESRRNEVLGFADPEAGRPVDLATQITPLLGHRTPHDTDYVTYVWFDALVNYISALEYFTPRTTGWPSLLARRCPSRQEGYPHHARRLLVHHVDGAGAAAPEDHLRPRLVDGGRRKDVQRAAAMSSIRTRWSINSVPMLSIFPAPRSAVRARRGFLAQRSGDDRQREACERHRQPLESHADHDRTVLRRRDSPNEAQLCCQVGTTDRGVGQTAAQQNRNRLQRPCNSGMCCSRSKNSMASAMNTSTKARPGNWRNCQKHNPNCTRC